MSNAQEPTSLEITIQATLPPGEDPPAVDSQFSQGNIPGIALILFEYQTPCCPFAVR